MRTMQQIAKGSALGILGLVLASGAVDACVQPSNGAGTVSLPPPCTYIGAQQLHAIVKGLPPNTIILLDPIHNEFVCGNQCRVPGGPLGGEVESFSSTATFHLSVSGGAGTPLAGWTRTVTVPLSVQVATGPRDLSAPVQSFKTDMQRLQGSINNDPDFDLFEVIGGTANGFPSPGITTLSQLSGNMINGLFDGTFEVESSFDIGYQIRFIGSPGGTLAGYEGTTTGSVTMKIEP